MLNNIMKSRIFKHSDGKEGAIKKKEKTKKKQERSKIWEDRRRSKGKICEESDNVLWSGREKAIIS